MVHKFCYCMCQWLAGTTSLTNLVLLTSIKNLSFYMLLNHLHLFLSTLNEFGTKVTSIQIPWIYGLEKNTFMIICQTRFFSFKFPGLHWQVKTVKLANYFPNKNKFHHNRKWASSPQKMYWLKPTGSYAMLSF